MYMNADSLLNKRHELEFQVRENKPHIIGISEVKPKNFLYPLQKSEINIDGYECFSSLSQLEAVEVSLGSTLTKMPFGVS